MRMFSQEYLVAEKESPVTSFETLANAPAKKRQERSQLVLLLHHFLDRFFNNEMVSADEEGKTRLIQIACAAGVPGLVVALYLWAVYHPLFRWLLPSAWDRVEHHFFFPMYSFVAMGIVTIFEWDMFFPDLLDIFVLSTLPIKPFKVFLARIAAVSIFIFGFLVDCNFMAAFILPVSIDPPNLLHFLEAHLLSVTAAGIFSAALVLTLQGMFLAVFGERFFRKISFLLQGTLITTLLICLLFFPLLTGILPALIESGNSSTLYFPPFWFLGIYEWLMEGPAALPIYARLAHTGLMATFLVTTLAIFFYPIAYWRKTRQLVLGVGTHSSQKRVTQTISNVLHTSLLRRAEYRAIYHFISQTLLRIQRYRIYLIMYGGLGLSLILANIFQLKIQSGHLHVGISSQGLRFAIPVAAFWVVAGLRLAFLSPGDQRGNWIFQTIHRKPGVELLIGTKIWVWLSSMSITLCIVVISRFYAPPDFQGWQIAVGQTIMATGLCLLLTDLFFLNVKIIPFTGVRTEVQPNLAISLLKYFSFFPLTIWLTLNWEPRLEASVLNMIITVILIVGIHAVLCVIHRRTIENHLNLPYMEDENPLLMKLGLPR